MRVGKIADKRVGNHVWAGRGHFTRSFLVAVLLLGILLQCQFSRAVLADTNEATTVGSSSSSAFVSYFENWFQRVDQIRAEQPNWASAMVTTSPLLNEVIRYDISQQSLANGHNLTSFGSAKGVEFIPVQNVQFIVSIPEYHTLNTNPQRDGWADENFLMKYRFLTGDADHGNYVLTGFLGLSVPSGSGTFTSHHFVFTPTIAGGKGWGDFDLQSTLGVSVPDNEAGRRSIGTPILWNVVAQYRIAKYFWPDTEVNYTYWPSDPHEGLNQVFLTPGIVFGRFPVWSRVGLMVGVGCQFAVSEHPLYRRNYLLSLRLPF